MSGLFRRLGTALIALGVDPRKTWLSLRFVPGYLRDLMRWRRLAKAEGPRFQLRLLPTLAERYASSGVASGHYFHQDLWVARQVHRAAPSRHLDVGSRVDGFVAHLLCFREVEVLDIRALTSSIPGLRFRQADLMSRVPPTVEAADSVSCLHALEHFGLGRYGDPLEPAGWQFGLQNLALLVRPGGCLYLGVPIGRPAIEFNAQRIFHPQYIVDEAVRQGLRLQAFAHVDDSGALNESPDLPDQASFERLAQMDYGCGLFVFRKPLEGAS